MEQQQKMIELLMKENEQLKEKVKLYEEWIEFYHKEKSVVAELHKVQLELQELKFKNNVK